MFNLRVSGPFVGANRECNRNNNVLESSPPNCWFGREVTRLQRLLVSGLRDFSFKWTCSFAMLTFTTSRIAALKDVRTKPLFLLPSLNPEAAHVTCRKPSLLSHKWHFGLAVQLQRETSTPAQIGCVWPGLLPVSLEMATMEAQVNHAFPTSAKTTISSCCTNMDWLLRFVCRCSWPHLLWLYASQREPPLCPYDKGKGQTNVTSLAD